MSLQDLEKQYPPGTKVELKGAVFAYTWGGLSFWEGDGKYAKEQGYLRICDATVSGVVVEFNATQQAVASIDANLEKLANEYHTQCAELRERRNALLQITFDGEVLPADTSHKPDTAWADDDDIPF